MTEPEWKSGYPVRVSGLQLQLYPRRAVLEFESEGSTRTLTLHDPRQLAPICDRLDDCFELRVVDLNAEDRGQREFGRYRLEIWDEDNPIGTVLCDAFDV